jgi:hypothetical protein
MIIVLNQQSTILKKRLKSSMVMQRTTTEITAVKILLSICYDSSIIFQLENSQCIKGEEDEEE